MCIRDRRETERDRERQRERDRHRQREHTHTHTHTHTGNFRRQKRAKERQKEGSKVLNLLSSTVVELCKLISKNGPLSECEKHTQIYDHGGHENLPHDRSEGTAAERLDVTTA